MGSEGGIGGFFHVFDWNRKARKKLFSNGHATSEKTMLGSRNNDDLPTSQTHLIGQDEQEEVASTKESGHHSGSSMTEEEGSAFKAPGVIAKLMGLDYIPMSGISESHSTALCGSHSLQDGNSQTRGTEMCTNDNSYCVNMRSDIYSGKPELKSQKMPSSLIETFHRETLPPRSATTISISYHKLFSPVKDSGLVSSKNASNIIDAAAKILESELHSSSLPGVHSLKSPMNSSKVRDSCAIIAIPKKISMLAESSERIAERGSSGSVRGHTLRRSSKWSKENTVSWSFQRTDGAHPSGGKDKGKPVSLATQTKVTYQKRIKKDVKYPVVQKDKEGCSFNKSKSPLNDQKNNQQKRILSVNGTSVLRQNNKKQCYTASKSKLASPSLDYGQQGLKILPGDASSKKNKIVHKLPGDAKTGYMKKGFEIADPDRDRMSLDPKNFTRKKRLVENSSSIRFRSHNDIPPGRHGKQVQHNVVMDEQSRWHDGNAENGMNIVSFTFTCPTRQSISRSHASNLAMKNLVEYSNYPCEADVSSDNEVLSPSKLNAIEGDHLGMLLERKLQELTSGARSPYRGFKKDNALQCTSNVDDSTSAFNVHSFATAERNGKLVSMPADDELSGSFDSDSLASDHAEFMSHKLEEADMVEHQHQCSKVEESEYQDQRSPLCYSIESQENSDGCMMSSSSSCIHNQDVVDWNCLNQALPMKPESEIPHTDSSISKAEVSEIGIGNHAALCRQELDYVKEILTNMGFTFKDLIQHPVDYFFEILDPILFDKLEETKTYAAYEGDEKNHRIRRKILFDSVNECLALRHRNHFWAGYHRSWARGAVVVAKELAEELYNEISGWRSIGDWMLDELLHKDMSTHLGSWVSFKIEESEVGVRIQTQVLSSLFDEIVADFL